MRYTIRIARLDDIPRLPPIEHAAGMLFEQAGISGNITVMSTDALRAALDEDGLLVAADESDQPVGFAVYAIHDDTAHLAEMDVHPDHGRRGLGGRLLQTVIHHARQHGCAQVTLTTYRDVPWNGPFYARHGFQEIPDTAWTPALAERADAEGVRAGGRRIVMTLRLHRR
ncbi:MAG: GNAT family N-acetyltransferase [Myxococcota bacterium]